MKQKELKERVGVLKVSTKEALQMLYNEVPQGQQKQLVKKKQIKELFDRYGVEY